MPFSLCRAFQEELRFESRANTYPDGSSDRVALVLNARHFFRLSPRVTPTQWQALRDFYVNHRHSSFYFYNPRETPNWHGDPTGASTVGRYTVVFDGAFSDSIGMGRSDVSIQLREVA